MCRPAVQPGGRLDDLDSVRLALRSETMGISRANWKMAIEIVDLAMKNGDL